ncbi:MAG: elongation factor Ts [Chloroflexi bacterium]|nr:elongation factor Ts [Chloroflexota bacterium]
MVINIDAIKTLRERTQAGVMDCRQALEEAGGDMDQATAILRDKGLATASKRADRETNHGLVEAYIHGGRIGALVELNCETDFVARTDLFKTLAHDIAMQVASMQPTVICPEDLDPDAAGSPEQLALLAQPFIKDQSKSVQDRINETVASTGEKIKVRRMMRYSLGE